jgi:hydroxyacylglutathione hydrolase
MTTLVLSLNNALANFNYLIYCPKTRDCCVVDPLEVDLILEHAAEQDLNITQIINTHEHWDHTGGNEALKAKTGARIFAHHGAKDLIPGFDQGVHAGEIIQIGESIKLTVLETPGHTLHSICLLDKKNSTIFTGDTLFNCGCGNCRHGGNPEILFETFENQLQHLPDETLLYPGHDYLQNNLKFAQSLQPHLSVSDSDFQTLGEDKKIDPFFRLEDPELIESVAKKIHLPNNPTRKEVFLALRKLRDQW